MTPKRTAVGATAALLVAVLLTLFAGPAAAQYPPGGLLTLDKIVVPQGGTVVATATGYAGGADVTFTLFSDPINLGTRTANAEGVAVIEFTIPSDFPLGPHTVTSSGIGAAGPQLDLSAELTVVAAGGGGGGGTSGGGTGTLPRTGSDSTNLFRAGALLVAAGAAVVLVTRKRSQAKVSA